MKRLKHTDLYSISSLICSMLFLSVIKLSYPKYHFTLFLLLHGCQSTKYKIMCLLLTAPSSNSNGDQAYFFKNLESVERPSRVLVLAFFFMGFVDNNKDVGKFS